MEEALEEALELDTQSQIFLEMRRQNLELLRIATEVAGYTGEHGPLKPAICGTPCGTSGKSSASSTPGSIPKRTRTTRMRRSKKTRSESSGERAAFIVTGWSPGYLEEAGQADVRSYGEARRGVSDGGLGGRPGGGHLRLIDQTRLPTEFIEIDCHDVPTVWEAIKLLRVRALRPSASRLPTGR